MSQLVKYLEQLNLPEGFSESRLQGVRFFKAMRHIPRTPIIYDSGIVIIAQGSKVGYLGDQTFHYNADNYLVLSVAIPFECETFASPESPLLGVYIDVDLSQLHDLIAKLGHRTDFEGKKRSALPRGIGPAALQDAVVDATTRLVQCLQSETEAQILGPGLVREILFRALCGDQAPALYALATHNDNFSRIALALRSIHSDFSTNLDVDMLARKAHMSTSAFHRAFKEVTADSPVQYLKKVRLGKALEFMAQKGMKAYVAADKVGYESASQFSREFKRYYGRSPAEMSKGLRTT